MNKFFKKNKAKVKNYLLLILLFGAFITITLYLCNLYNVYDEYQKETPVIRGTLLEITNEELGHYLIENPTAVIYMCTSSDMVCRNYEKDLKKLVKQKNLQDKMVYLNLSNINQEEFVKNFNSTYKSKKGLTTNYPAIIFIEDGEIESILQGTEKEQLTITRTKQFIELNKIDEMGD